ncbi:Uncharacterised protein [Mycobacteroides abscessus]|nr:Uncharacterised protein [Mycobacteroides abscessus]
MGSAPATCGSAVALAGRDVTHALTSRGKSGTSTSSILIPWFASA